MTFMLGPFLGGLASGAKTGMDLYTQYQGIKTTEALKDAVKTAKDADTGAALSTTPTTTGTTGVKSDAAQPQPGYNTGEDKPLDLSTMPGHNAKSESKTTQILNAVGNGANAWGKTNSDASNKGTYENAANPTGTPTVGADGQGKQGVSTAPVNMTTYDTQSGQPGALNGPSPPSAGQQRGSGPDMSHLTNKPVGSTIGDWLHGRTTAPVYTPQQNQKQALPTAPTGTPVAKGSGALATGGSAANTPTLANQQTTLGQSLLNSLSGNSTENQYTTGSAM